MHLKWGSGERGAHIYQNSKVYVKCVHIILSKLYLNKMNKKEGKINAEGWDYGVIQYVINCQITTHFSSHWEVKYCIPDLGWQYDLLCSMED